MYIAHKPDLTSPDHLQKLVVVHLECTLFIFLSLFFIHYIDNVR